MTITLEAIRAAGGIVHSDGNIFFRDISMLQGLAGAAPAAVTPRARDLLGIVRTAQAEARRLINGEDSGSDLAQTKLDLPETLRVLEHALSQPAAVAGVAWDKTRDSLATLLLGLARRPFLDFDVACIALDAATEPGMPLAYMRGATAAPAAPEPVGEAGTMPGTSGFTMACFHADKVPLGTKLYTQPLAAAPQAPAALDVLGKIAEIAACWGCDHPDEPGDTELLRRVKWASRQLRADFAAPQAPAAPTEPGRLDDGMQIRCRKCGEQATIAYNSARIVTHNPHTGKPRDARDIASDPEGKLIVGPEQLRAAISAASAKAAPAAPAVDARDTARMDWLEAQVVNVRAPLRYGSRDLFWASPEEVDGGPDGPSDLRARIDAAQAKEGGA